ncbi:MAG: hypothetical protein ACK5NC_00740 [Vibrio sp.]
MKLATIKRWRGELIGILGIILAFIFYLFPRETSPTASDEFIRTTTPTVIELKNASFQNWLGDPEKALTLKYENISKVKANQFKASIYINGVPFEPFTSTAFKEVNMDHLSIGAHKSLELPVLLFSQLQKRIKGTICGIGLNQRQYDPANSSLCGNAKTLHSTKIKVLAQYQTIFKERIEKHGELWVYSCDTGCDSVGKIQYEVSVKPVELVQ